MNSKHYLVLSGIVGGVVGSLLTALLVPPVTAQRDKFGEIECTGLRVVDKDGDEVVKLSWNIQHGGRVSVLNKQALGPQTLITSDHIAVGDGFFFGPNGIRRGVRIGVDGHGGFVSAAAQGQEGTSKVWLGVDEHGGRVDVHGKDSALSATTGASEHGGKFLVNGKDGAVKIALGVTETGGGFGLSGEGDTDKVTIAVTEQGDGIIGVRGKGDEMVILNTTQYGGSVAVVRNDGKLGGMLHVDEYGGQVMVRSKGEGFAEIGISEHGNGIVSTWDKNGYRQK